MIFVNLLKKHNDHKGLCQILGPFEVGTEADPTI